MLILAFALSFFLILYLAKKGINLGFATAGSGMLLALLTGLSIPDTVRVFLLALVERDTVELALDVFLIIVLSKLMQEYGILDKMVESLERLFGSPKALLYVIPCLLSAFSAVGAAIIAAPVIDRLGDEVGLDKARKAAINLYLRHAWYFVLPISVSLLNAAYVSGVPLVELIKAQVPTALACLVAGYLVYFRPIKGEQHNYAQKDRSIKTIMKTIQYMAPLLISVVLVIWIPFYVALLAACVLTYLLRENERRLYDILIKGQGKSYNLIYAVAGIMVFKRFIENIPEIETLLQSVTNLGIPLWIIAVISSLVLAFISGSTNIVTAMLYPLLLPLVPPDQLLAMTMLIYVTGFAFYYISPLHLCQVLTNEYFGVSLGDLYREYVITVPVMLLAGVITYFVIR
ncbi:MAG: DUF401 family protein [Peptococcaceae bacterium]|jgi:integral membrane protein (TIGR00529 family)|nr:DUF401 family protein [Peptococcaceae bacterium]MDH7524268.1 DUF401 family protein [Peptococcaceae bacterium]